MTRDRAKSLLKAVPGFAISAGFIWWTYIRRHPDGKRGFDPAAFHALHLTSPFWIAAVLALSFLGYFLRCVRWWWMLRSVGARLYDCSRILMTSLAANNILPLRIGDIMRVFTYAEDLGATPSTILSTVILEKLLDVFTLAVLLVITMQFSQGIPAFIKHLAEVGVGASTVGLLLMIFGARRMHKLLLRLTGNTKNRIIAKVEHYLDMAVECIENIGALGTLMLVVFSALAWGCEGFMYVSMAKLFGLVTPAVGPWQGMVEANLSFLIPSSPGGIGIFEKFCSDALSRQGLSNQIGVAFGTLMHVWLLVGITGVGGAMFLAHRARMTRRKPLLQEVEDLPSPAKL